VAAVLIQMVPLGLAAAMSPVPIMTSVTLTGGRRPRVSVGAYVLGGLLAYAVLGAIGIALIGQSSGLTSRGHPSTLAFTIQVVIGGFFLAFALFSLVTRQSQNGAPRWMSALAGFGPGRAFLAGIVILSPHLKNLLLLAAAFTAIGAAKLGLVSGAVAILLFMAITLAPVLAPLVVHLTQPPERAAATTGAWKGWLERNNQIILAVVFGVMGLKLLEEGLVGLLS
jgi:hypothetical protein